MMRSHLAPPLSAAAVALLLAACGGDRVVDAKLTLRYHPPAGAVYRYALEQRNTMTMEAGPLTEMGEQTLEMRMHFTQAVTGPVPGGVEVRVTFDSTDMEVPGMPAEMLAVELERLRGLVSTVLLDERAHVLTNDFGTASAVSPALASQLAAGVKAMAFALPLRLSGALSGDQLFSLTRGAVVRGTMKGKMRVNVTGGLFGRQGMVLSSDNETNMRLAGAPSSP